jgi:hypothetical protein
MTKHFATLILIAAVAFSMTVAASERQGQRANASRSAALRLRPGTLAIFINSLAGLQVQLVRGVVDEIGSPRVFTLRNERGARYPFQPNEVAIVVDTGSTMVRKGAPVVVTGIARTLLGAEMDSNRPLQSLTESERKIVANRPLVMASSVQTPDGVQLARVSP